MYIDTMQQVYSSVTKVMVDSRQGSNLLYLPLDKLMQQGNGSGTAAASAAPATSGSQPAEPSAPLASGNATDSRSRDGLRTRDRDAR